MARCYWRYNNTFFFDSLMIGGFLRAGFSEKNFLLFSSFLSFCYFHPSFHNTRTQCDLIKHTYRDENDGSISYSPNQRLTNEGQGASGFTEGWELCAWS